MSTTGVSAVTHPSRCRPAGLDEGGGFMWLWEGVPVGSDLVQIQWSLYSQSLLSAHRGTLSAQMMVFVYLFF